MYGMGIEDFSASSLQSIFINHMRKSDKLLFPATGWKGYRPIAKTYNTTQMESNKRLNYKSLHTMNHQIKSWKSTTYS